MNAPLLEKPAIQRARELYNKWARPGTSFDQELTEYLEKGMVFVRPDLFMLAKIIDLQSDDPRVIIEPVWFVRMGVGRLSELVRALPIYLPKICFTRTHGNQLKLRSLPFKRFAQLSCAVASQENKENNHGQ